MILLGRWRTASNRVQTNALVFYELENVLRLDALHHLGCALQFLPEVGNGVDLLMISSLHPASREATETHGRTGENVLERDDAHGDIVTLGLTFLCSVVSSVRARLALMSVPDVLDAPVRGSGRR